MAILSWAAQAFGAPAIAIGLLVVLVVLYFLTRIPMRRGSGKKSKPPEDAR